MKKGSLQLSVGAIITLIIAVALLGLIISFVATQFSFFSGRIALQEETPEPDARNQITLPGDRTSLTLAKSEEYEMVIKVYNPSDTDYTITSGSFDLSCDNSDLDDKVNFDAAPAEILAGNTGEISTLVSLESDAPLGRAACTLKIGTDSSRSIFILVE